MKTICIYHSIDLDGWMSAAIVKYWWLTKNPYDSITNLKLNNKFDKNANDLINDGTFYPTKYSNNLWFLGFNYGDSIPDLSQYNKVIMCDTSFSKEEMYKLWHNLDKEFIWIDHHISAIKDNNDLVYKGLRDIKFAACELTWQYFFPNESMPEIVRLLGRYDCFGHKNTDEELKVLEFQYGFRQRINNYEIAYEYLTSEFDYNIIHAEGKTIYQYLWTEAKQSYKNGFEIRLFTYTEEDHMNPHKFICINRERFNPINFGIDYHKDGYDGCASFYFDGEQYNFSLYNGNGLVDVSLIAKQFGGGGHKGAAGFKIKNLNTIIHA